MFKLKEKNKICRKYSQDIWGNLVKKKKVTKVVIYLLKLRKEKRSRNKAFFLDIKAPKPLKRRRARSRYCKNLDTIKKLSFFCGGLRKKKIKQIAMLAQKKGGVYMENFYYLIELRLSVIVYRMNFCYTILEAMQYIYAGYILVNKEVIKNVGFVVNIGDIVEVVPYKRKYFVKKFRLFLRTKQVLHNQLHFVAVNYECLRCIVLGNLQVGLIKYPFRMAKQYGYMFYRSKI